ncbi:N-acetylmuramoyl-L-alanine amidase [Jeotgalibacillus proteolyticus]|uniref:N-acetylmuramoyl-L-alanine amidase n=1 Tax=Jeotgalibacillus proteolyticus TaxID=2082395 RepID=UPI003CF425FA
MNEGKYLNLMPHMTSWRVYAIGTTLTAGNEVGQLAPATFGGLSYRIVGNPSADVYTIRTESFGTVNIYAPRDNDSSINNVAQFDNESNSTGSGDYLNLQPHMNSWRVYPIGVSPVAGNEVGSLAPATFGGLSYRIVNEPSGDLYTIETESFGRVNIFAPRDPDSTITNSPEFSNGGDRGSSGSGGGQFLNLAPHMTSWRVYPLGASPVSGNEIGNLAPSRYGGLSYEILGQPSSNLYTILTESFGRVNIYAPEDNDSTFSDSPLYLDSADGSAGATHGLYLNLMPHISSWRVYPLGVSLIRGNEVGNLGPSMFGGLTYKILGSVGADSYTINTESFGTVNIYAPRDNDSSITSTPLFGVTGGNTAPSDGGYTPPTSGGGNEPIVSNPNGVKIFLDAGHGGHDPGATGNGLVEKNVNLIITRELGRILAENGANVQFRRSYDTFNELNEIVNMANNSDADLFISIHCNANPNSAASGTECYTYNPSQAESELSAAIAQSISTELILNNRGAKQDNFRVITYTTMPAILVETGFLSNSYDAYILRTQPEKFAQAIATAIISKLGITPPAEEGLTEQERKKQIRDVRADKIEKIREVYPTFRENVEVSNVLPTLEFGRDVEVPFNYGVTKGKFIFSTSYKLLGSSSTKISVKDGQLQGEIGDLVRDKILENHAHFNVAFNPDLLDGFAVQMQTGDIRISVGFNNTTPIFSIALNMPDLKIQDGTNAGFSIVIEFHLNTNLPGIPAFVEEPIFEQYKEYVTSPEFTSFAKKSVIFAATAAAVVVLMILISPYIGAAIAAAAAAAAAITMLLVVMEELADSIAPA